MENTIHNTYSTMTDHLGSLTMLIDDGGDVVAEQAYDAWGNVRSASDWSQGLTTGGIRGYTKRGYTLHEHLEEFNLIHMNGRVYCPTTMQFLSPDPYIQAPSLSHNYNRYSYCLNNPLLFSDPSGYQYYKQMSFFDSGLRNYSAWYNTGPSRAGGGGGGSYRSPGWSDGKESNGTGLGGVYYDWYSNSLRLVDEPSKEVEWEYVFDIIKGGIEDYEYQAIGLNTPQTGVSEDVGRNGISIEMDGFFPVLSSTQIKSIDYDWIVSSEVGFGFAGFLTGATIAKQAFEELNKYNKNDLLHLQEQLMKNHRVNSILINNKLLKVVRNGKMITRIGFAGNIAGLASVGVDIIEQEGAVRTENVLDGISSIIAFIPPYGWAVSTAYSVGEFCWKGVRDDPRVSDFYMNFPW